MRPFFPFFFGGVSADAPPAAASAIVCDPVKWSSARTPSGALARVQRIGPPGGKLRGPQEDRKGADSTIVDFKIGAIPAITMPDENPAKEGSGIVQASVLAVRPPRASGRTGAPPSRDAAADRGAAEERRRRRMGPRTDPPGARVLTLLVSDPSGIPADAESGAWRVVVRFVRQG